METASGVPDEQELVTPGFDGVDFDDPEEVLSKMFKGVDFDDPEEVLSRMADLGLVCEIGGEIPQELVNGSAILN